MMLVDALEKLESTYNECVNLEHSLGMSTIEPMNTLYSAINDLERNACSSSFHESPHIINEMQNQWDHEPSSPYIESSMSNIGEKLLTILKASQTFPMSPRQREEFGIDLEGLFSILHMAHMHRRGLFESEIRAFEEFMENALHW